MSSINLSATIEFDSPFTVAPGGNVFHPLFGIYAPSVEHCVTEDILIDSDDWEAFSVGYTGQYGYNGPVMHASEILGGRLAEDILNTPGTYVVCAVEYICDVENPECHYSPYDRATMGCGCDPAGWTVLKYVK